MVLDPSPPPLCPIYIEYTAKCSVCSVQNATRPPPLCPGTRPPPLCPGTRPPPLCPIYIEYTKCSVCSVQNAVFNVDRAERRWGAGVEYHFQEFCMQNAVYAVYKMLQDAARHCKTLQDTTRHCTALQLRISKNFRISKDFFLKDF